MHIAINRTIVDGKFVRDIDSRADSMFEAIIVDTKMSAQQDRDGGREEYTEFIVKNVSQQFYEALQLIREPSKSSFESTASE